MKKKVLMFAMYDWANSGFKTSEAVNRCSDDYEVEYFAVNPHVFGYERGSNIILEKVDSKVYQNNEVVARLRKVLEKCDIMHFKGDEGVPKTVAEIEIDRLNKPVVWTVCGRVWEAKHSELWDEYGKYTDALLATTPDHLQHGIEGTWMPLPIDVERYKPIPRADDCIVIQHSTTAERKGTELINQVFTGLYEEYSKVFCSIHSNIPFQLAMQLKRISHIFVDQINRYNIYANSALEAMAIGAATVASCDWADGITYATEKTLHGVLIELIESPEKLLEAQRLAREYAEQVHSYHAVSAKLCKVYDRVLKRGTVSDNSKVIGPPATVRQDTVSAYEKETKDDG